MVDSKLYSVPRRFDLVTIVVATGACALLFATMRALNSRALVFAYVGGLFATVAIAQAVFPKSPRAASMIASAVYCITIGIIGIALSPASPLPASPSDVNLLVGMLGTIIAPICAVLGYFVGIMI